MVWETCVFDWCFVYFSFVFSKTTTRKHIFIDCFCFLKRTFSKQLQLPEPWHFPWGFWLCCFFFPNLLPANPFWSDSSPCTCSVFHFVRKKNKNKWLLTNNRFLVSSSDWSRQFFRHSSRRHHNCSSFCSSFCSSQFRRRTLQNHAKHCVQRVDSAWTDLVSLSCSNCSTLNIQIWHLTHLQPTATPQSEPSDALFS